MRIIQRFIQGIFIGTFFCCGLGCTSNEKPQLTVQGKLAGAEDQLIYLEELYFVEKAPEILDTARLEKGIFTLSTPLTKPGLYRIRLEKGNRGFLFINDQPTIRFTGNMQQMGLDGPRFFSRANEQFRQFMLETDRQRKDIDSLHKRIDALDLLSNKQDSLLNVARQAWKRADSSYQQYLMGYLDTVHHPVLAMIVVGFTGDIDPLPLEPIMNNLDKRFADQENIRAMVNQYRELLVKYKAKPREGNQAPEISLPDTSGKTITLSSLRGNYVLVDFWASWCRPCREENPNIVKAYQQFKNKNFTILGVSLDKERMGWTEAIRTDKLAWTQVSDLKFWSGQTIKKYGVEAIPYNVLLDTAGKIVAVNLRGPKLAEKLSQVLPK